MDPVYTVAQYSPEHYHSWNAFVAGAKNATFLFHRDFMEYHGSRFRDFSLLVFKNNVLISVLPAHVTDNAVHSHRGLSYGGFVFDRSLKFRDCLEAVKHTLRYCAERQLSTLHLKPIPRSYHRLPADEIDYLLFLLNARLTQRKLSSCVAVAKSSFAGNRREGLRRGQKNKLKIAEETDFTRFWNELLIPRLRHKFRKAPVHSLEEIRYLKEKFPENIRQFNVYANNTLVAGTIIFETHETAHTQYIASNTTKNQLGSLDFLFHYLIGEVFKTKTWFDFGTSNADEGQHINEGLLYWKQGYGNGTVAHDCYEINTGNHTRLNAVFI